MRADALSELLQAELQRLPPGPVAVGFSGGMDSSVLLHALAHTAAARQRGLRAIHVDHGLHADSSRWVTQCRRAAAELDVDLRSERVQVEASIGMGREAAARAARMAAFAAALSAGEILALAQHADDQAETVLLKLLRGAGPEGVGGMRRLRRFAAGVLWRPLLALPRAALRDYADAHHLDWIEDPSNSDLGLRRNFLRHEILPRLQQHWPQARAALAHSAAWARNAAAFIEEQATQALQRLRGSDPATLHWRAWIVLPAALRDPVLRLWLRELGRDEPAHFHVAELERQLREAGPDRLPVVRWGRTELRRYRDLLFATVAPAPLPPHWETAWNGGELILPNGDRLLLLHRATGTPVHLTSALRVSSRRGGERLRPAGRAHTRELRHLLQEDGVPPWLRRRLPLVHDGEGALLAVADRYLSDAGQKLLALHDACIVWRHDVRND